MIANGENPDEEGPAIHVPTSRTDLVPGHDTTRKKNVRVYVVFGAVVVGLVADVWQPLHCSAASCSRLPAPAACSCHVQQKKKDIISFSPSSGVIPAKTRLRTYVLFVPPTAGRYVVRAFYEVHNDVDPVRTAWLKELADEGLTAGACRGFLQRRQTT